MGLDFYGFYVRKGENINSIFNMPYNEFEKRELFYARKGWELVHYLNCDVQHEAISRLDLQDWINLVEILVQVVPVFDDLEKAYDKDIRTPQENELIAAYEEWHKKNFEEYPQLGYDFSLTYMRNFWDAADKVVKYLVDPNYEVWMLASY